MEKGRRYGTRKVVTKSGPNTEAEQTLFDQFHVFQEKLESLREEGIRFRSVLGDRLQEEIESKQRLLSEKLELQEKYDQTAEECRKLRKRCDILTHRLEIAGLSDDGGMVSTGRDSSTHGINVTEESQYEGMLEFKEEDVAEIIGNLVRGLKPDVAATFPRCLPAYILFMCVRHADSVNDNDKVNSLLTQYESAVKCLIIERQDFETGVLWLCNTAKLLDMMKQYSGESPYNAENTDRQNQQCLKNLDLKRNRCAVNKTAVWIFKEVVAQLEKRIETLTVPALIEYQSWNETDSARAESLTVGERSELDKLLSELTSAKKTLEEYGINRQIVIQIFDYLFFFMCACVLNDILWRNDIGPSTTTQNKCNLSQIGKWARDHELSPATAVLYLIIESAYVFETRKADNDVNWVLEIFEELTASQIINVWNLDAPADNFETRALISYIKKAQANIEERGQGNEQLFMHLVFPYPDRIHFIRSNIRLEDIEVPEILNLSMLKKI